MKDILKTVAAKVLKLPCFCLIILLFADGVHAQQTENYPAGLWISYSLRKPVSKKISWNNDIQLRFRNNSAFYDYTLLRSGLQYEVSKKFNFSAGVLYGTDNINGKKIPVWKNEYRLWQDIKYFIGDLSGLHLMLQGRLEERWFDTQESTGNKETLFTTRFRFRTDVRNQFSENWKLMAGNELMYQLVKGRTNFNQYRIWFGGGYNFNIKNELQLQLMQIVLNTPDQTVLRINYLHQL